eukprot:Phypoly_transcript_10778.p1 GENE.Phypoly_transcript_10778~~Phypoly_transcript_10778.p1  ORF type:complete len:161 (+),score=26.88 Phypoly_transcript_10778:731-1213(+)
MCAEETNELKCPTCAVSYHKECSKKWLRSHKMLPEKFICVHCKSHVPGLAYENDPRGFLVVLSSRKVRFPQITGEIQGLTDPPVSQMIASSKTPSGFVLVLRFLAFRKKNIATQVKDGFGKKGIRTRWNHNHLITERAQYERYLKKNKIPFTKEHKPAGQ